MALISLSFKKVYKPTNNNLRTSSNTSRANQDNSPRINRGTGYENQRVVNVVGARENVEVWKDDTDDESDDQELEAHYMYMAQIQEVTPDIADISLMLSHYKREQDDQDDTDELAQERDLLASLIEKLKCEIDDSKNRNKFLESSNQALVDKLKGEIGGLPLRSSMRNLIGMYIVHTEPNQTRTPQLPQDIKNFKFSNNKTFVTACNDSLNAKTSNVNFVCVTCGKCVLNSNHDACISKLLKEVISRAKIKSHKTRNSNNPAENQKARIINIVGLRWIPTGKIFTSCTSKAHSESTHGSKVDISKIRECKQTLDLTAGTSLTGQQKQRIDFSAGTIFGEPPYPLNYPTRRLTMEEMLAKFIDKGRREHEEMEIFVKEFRAANELLLKTQSNLLSELKIKENELSKVVSNVLIPKNKVKGVTTRGGKITSEVIRSKEINETGINKNEPLRFE
ncbi:hypothetical protein Tco_1146475 [Tanacetum coccineum]